MAESRVVAAYVLLTLIPYVGSTWSDHVRYRRKRGKRPRAVTVSRVSYVQCKHNFIAEREI
jgi:hypothetical protein